jgi:hypothetical protein
LWTCESRQSHERGPLGFRGLDQLFFAAENGIDLLRRCQPQNGPEARARWLEALRSGKQADFAWRYAPAPDFDGLKRALDEALGALAARGPLETLYAERAEELRVEAELAECVGTARFFVLARKRYPLPDVTAAQATRELAAAWANLAPTPDPGPTTVSDDRRAPGSLLNLLQRELGRLRLPVRVEVMSSLGSRAASGEGVIFIQAGVPLGAREAWRITQHEILGHALPRVHARAQPVGLYRVGSARAADDEEGRALCIEQRLDLLDARRRRELGRRHLAAVAVAEGASATDCVRLLIQRGAEPGEAATLYARIARGGGLCRELVYLPAWLRATQIFSLDPDLERWPEHGRVSFDAARSLREQGLVPTEP